jgi:hypothetical protein
MLKQLVGAVVLVLALAGPLAVETQSTSPAQANNLNATASPLYAKPGATISVVAVDPCPQPMTVFWDQGPGSPSGSVNTDAKGYWSFTFKAPTTVGVIPIFARCAFSIGANASAMYKQLNVTIVAPTPPTYPG